MWSVGSDKIDVYLGATAVGMAHGGRLIGWTMDGDLWSAVAGWSELVRPTGWRRWSRPRVRVWLSGGLAPPFLVTPPEGLTSWFELERIARAQAARTGSAATSFPMPMVLGETDAAPSKVPVVHVESWPGPGAALCVACNALLIDLVYGVLGARFSVHSIRPWWALALAAARGFATSSFVARDADSLVFLACDDTGGWRAAERIATTNGEAEARGALLRKLVYLDEDPSRLVEASLDRTLLADARRPWVRMGAGTEDE